MSAVMNIVKEIKRSLTKEIETNNNHNKRSDDGEEEDHAKKNSSGGAGAGAGASIISIKNIEAVQDMLQRLNDCDMTIQILMETKIGRDVSKLKKHMIVGNQAKAIVKKWRKIVKVTEEGDQEHHGNSSPAAAAVSPHSSASVSSHVAVAASSATRRNGDATTTTETFSAQESELEKSKCFQNLKASSSSRQTVVRKLFHALGNHKKSLVTVGMNSKTIDHLLVTRSLECERILYEKNFQDNNDDDDDHHHNSSSSSLKKKKEQQYLNKANLICTDLGSTNNELLSHMLVLGQQVQSQDIIELGCNRISRIIHHSVNHPDDISMIPSQQQEEKSKIMFFSNSKHSYPGKGSSEYLTPTDETNDVFHELYKNHTEFRKKLSNFYEITNNNNNNKEGFYCAGRHWKTVEHCFQGRKFEYDYPNYTAQFALDSKSILSQSDGSAARRAGGKKARPLTQLQRGRWERRKHHVMMEALYARYSQHTESRTILLATHNAILLHRPPRSKLVVVRDLMLVRDMLQAEEKELEEEEEVL